MRFLPLPLNGAWLIELERREDHRGFFARVFCRKEFEARGLNPNVAQVNTSYSKLRGTLRGMHYQIPPAAEAKVVRCLRGALWDVILDLRCSSPNFGKWHGVELTAENRHALYVPEGFAHGFLTLEPDTEAFYQVTEYYSPGHERCVRWNDPRFAIKWPFPPIEISDKDQNQKDFDACWHLPSPEPNA